MAEWYATWGCTAEFIWVYNSQGHKHLDVSAIDLAIHRCPVRGETLARLIEEHEKGPQTIEG